MIGTSELIIILLVVFVLFGASSIPKFAKAIGEAKREFQKGASENKKDDEHNTQKPEK